MPTLTIGDHRVNVDDSFLKLSPEQQNSAVEEISQSLPRTRSPVTDPALLAALNAPPAAGRRVTDPALLAALNDGNPPEMTLDQRRAVALASGRARAASADDTSAAPKSTLQTIREAIHAPTRILENGVFMGLGDRARAVIDSGVEAIGGGGFNYGTNLKREQGESEQFATAHPIAAPVLEGVGGVAAPIGVMAAAAKGVGLGAKILYGGGAGGAIGGVQGAFASKDWTNLPQVAKDTAFGGTAGLLIGGAVPATGAAIGAGYRAAANLFSGKVEGMSRGASSHLVRAVEADGPDAVRARLAELGPDAMLADAGAGLFATTQGTIGNSMEARTVMTKALAPRDAGTNARVMGDVNRALGPAEDPQTVKNAIEAHRTAVDGVNYPAALDNAPAVQTAPILQQIDGMIPGTPVGSMERRALTNLRGMLMTTERRPLLDVGGNRQYDHLGNERWHEVPVSQNDPNVLHKVKTEMDRVINYDEPGLGLPAGAAKTAQGTLKQMRFQINDALERQVPGYGDANAASSALAKRMEAVGEGTQYLGSGKTTASPGRFADEFAHKPGVQEPRSIGEQIAFAKGSRGEIERILGTKANDLQALRGELQGEGGWNTAKIATVHGQPAADEVVATVNRNLKFRETHNEAIKGAQTDLRNAIRKEMKPDPSTATDLINPNMSPTGLLLGGGKRLLNAAYNAVRPDATRSFGEVARVLSAQGPARDAQLQAIIDAIAKRKGNAAGGAAVGNAGALLTALAGDAARRRQTQQRP